MNEIFQSIRNWAAEDFWTVANLMDLLVVAAALTAAALIARRLKRRLAPWIDRGRFSNPAVRFLRVFNQCLPAVTAIALLGIGAAGAEQISASGYLISTAASLLTAWVAIQLIGALLQDSTWTRLIGLAAWTIAALHILGLLGPLLELLDSLAVQFSGVRISILLLIKSVIVLAVLLHLALSVSKMLEARICQLETLTPSMQVLLTKSVKIVLLLTAAMAGVSSLGINLSTFAFFGGAVGVGLGFGLQKVVSNLISGVILLLDKSIKPGDVIELSGTYGRIQSLGARYASVVTRDGFEYLIPNEDLITQQVVNWSYSSNLIRLKIDVGVAYDTDVHQAMDLVRQAARSLPRVLETPAPVCQLKNFGDNSIDLELRIWISDPQNGVANVCSAARVAIWDTFKTNGIEIPFPQRDVHIKSVPSTAR